jgi:cyclase
MTNLNKRIIPVLTINNRRLVKTTQFKSPRYIGDPINALKIFNVKGPDEISIIEINSTNKKIDFEFLEDLASESFLPLSYGGNITKLEEVKKLISIGFEKIILRSAIFENPNLVKNSVSILGSQSVVACIDYYVEKSNFFIKTKTKIFKKSPLEAAKIALNLGVGEIIFHSINREGMMNGFDLELIKETNHLFNVPIIYLGGAKDFDSFNEAFSLGAESLGASSTFIFYGKLKGILITYPYSKL